MKKNYFLILLLLAVVMGSCKKDGAETKLNSDNVDAKSSNGFYKVGTVIHLTDSAILNAKGSKTSYVSRIPSVYTPGTANGYSGGALGGYSKRMSEVARSNNGLYSLFYQIDGNLVLYKRATPNGTVLNNDALWASNAYENSPLPPENNWDSSLGARATFQDDGNIVCFRADNSIYWTSGIVAPSGSHPIWFLQDDGNFVGYSNYTLTNNTFTLQGQPFAATFTNGGQKSNNFGKMGRTN